MFEFFFQYPRSVFSKGEFVFLGSWPAWVLPVLIAAAAVVLALLIRSRMGEAAHNMRSWRAGAIWLLESALAAALLLLLWQPALMISELKPQQNIVAVLVDDSRSMDIKEDGSTRREQAVKALEGGVLDDLKKQFQTRIYTIDSHLARVGDVKEINGSAPATRIGENLKELAAETSGLPIGAVVLLSDGADNSGGVDLDTISELRSRHIPVHTVGFGREQMSHDIEINDAHISPRTLADSRLAAEINFHQHGYAGRKAKLQVRDGNKILAGREVTLASDGTQQTETILFNAGDAGAKALRFSLDVLDGEENTQNNSVSRLVNVESGKRKILYMEGEPRWDYKFIRRAQETDKSIQLVSMVRTTENKNYRQDIDDPKELETGFPGTVEEMFRYQGLIIGSVEANYFTPTQQELIKQFVDRRGGGMLALGGRAALSDGGWNASPLADLLPVTLPNRKGTFQRDPATVSLTQAGADSIITRLVEDPQRNAERWKKMPPLADYQDPGTLKPGAAELLEMTVANRTMPLLVTENYGRGRTAIFATGGDWRWQMLQPVEDQTHEVFWQQVMRWLVEDTPDHVTTSIPSQILFDEGAVHLSAEVRDKNYLPAADASVEAHVMGPDGMAANIEMTPDPTTPGVFRADWTADKAGSYLTEVTAKRGDEEVGRDVLTFQRMDGVAENFHTEQNKDLLEKLSQQTGGRYWTPAELDKLGNEISYSEAGITVRETKELWNMPIVFLALIGLCFAEWLLRRKWGIV